MLNKERSFKEIKYRFERIILKNLFYFIMIFFALTYYQSSKMGDLAQSQNDIKEEMVKQRNSYVALDGEGIPLSLPRTYVGAKNNDAIVAEALCKLIVSRANITKNFTVSKFDEVTDIAEQSQSLSTFANEYIMLHKNLLDNLKIEKEDWNDIQLNNKKGIRYFTGYLKYLQNLLMADKLPHKLTIVDYQIISYVHNGSKFYIELRVNEIVDRYAGERDGKVLWDSKKGYTTIKAEGYFDIRLRTKRDKKLELLGLNTKGLRFTYLNIKYAI